MFTKRPRYHAAWASLLALTSACSDGAPGHPNHSADADGKDAATPTETSSSDDAPSSGASSDKTVQPTSETDSGASAAYHDSGAVTSSSLDAGISSAGPISSDATTTGAVAVDSASADGGRTEADTTDGGAMDAAILVDSGNGERFEDATSDGGTFDTGHTDGGVVDPGVAKAFFWDAFTQQRIDDGARASEQLEAAIEANPGDADLALLVAHSYLWRLSEFSRSANPDPSRLPALAGATEAAFGRAFAQAPDDARILGWLGSVMIGNGRTTGDAEKVGAGHALIEQGVAAYPEFNGFVLSLVNASAPAGTPEFDLALEAMWDNLDACAGFAVDRDAPDVRAVAEAVLEGEAAPVCANTSRAAHNLEGFFLYFGDLLVKANQETAARAMYDATRASPTFELWPYRETLAQRELQIAARLAAYANDDPSDDPALIAHEPFSCSYCHAASPQEPLPQTLDAVP